MNGSLCRANPSLGWTVCRDSETHRSARRSSHRWHHRVFTGLRGSRRSGWRGPTLWSLRRTVGLDVDANQLRCGDTESLLRFDELLPLGHHAQSLASVRRCWVSRCTELALLGLFGGLRSLPDSIADFAALGDVNHQRDSAVVRDRHRGPSKLIISAAVAPTP